MNEVLITLRALPLAWIANTALGLAIVCCVYRLLRGPSVADRVVALDLIGFLAVGIIAILSAETQQPALLTVAIVMALILFLGTAGFASYIERRSGGQ